MTAKVIAMSLNIVRPSGGRGPRSIWLCGGRSHAPIGGGPDARMHPRSDDECGRSEIQREVDQETCTEFGGALGAPRLVGVHRTADVEVRLRQVADELSIVFAELSLALCSSDS